MNIENKIIELAKKKFVSYFCDVETSGYGNNRRLWTLYYNDGIKNRFIGYRVGDKKAVELLS